MTVVLTALLKADHNTVSVVFQHFCGQPRHHIGLMHRRRDTGAGRLAHHGITGVTACTHHQIGLKFLQYGVGLTAAGHHFHQRIQVVPQLPRCQ